MATSLTIRRACWNVIRQIPRQEPRSSFCSATRSLFVTPQRCPSSNTFLPLSHIGGQGLCSSNSASTMHYYICRRNFFTKWFSTTSTKSSSKEKQEDRLQSTANSRTLQDGEDSANDRRKELEEEEEEESIIPKTDEKGQPLSNWKRMKIMMKAYGYVIIPVHWVIAPVWFGAFYYTIKLGVDIGPFLSAIGVSDHHVESLRSSKASTALMAYALYKIFTPLRYTVTLGATEVTIRRLRRMGYMRQKPPKEKTYTDSFKETVGEMRDKIKDRKDTKSS